MENEIEENFVDIEEKSNYDEEDDLHCDNYDEFEQQEISSVIFTVTNFFEK